MSTLQKPSSFCVFCYKLVDNSLSSVKTTENVEKFFNVVNRFASRKDQRTLYNDLSISKLVDCCYNCEKIVKEFCANYNNLKLLELKLDFILDKLVEKINYANNVPARWMHVNQVLEEAFPNGLDQKAESQRRIRAFRQNVIEAGHKRKLRSEPRVLLTQITNEIQLTENTSKIESTPFSHPDIETEYDGMPTLDDDSGDISDNVDEDHFSETQDALEELDTYICNDDIVTGNMDTLYGAAVFKDPLIQIKIERQPDVPDECLGFIGENVSTKSIVANIPQKGAARMEQGCEQIEIDILESEVHKCVECGKSLKSAYGLQVHLEYHKDPKDWKWSCTNCEKKFASKINLQAHKRSHTKKKTFKGRVIEERVKKVKDAKKKMKTKLTCEKEAWDFNVSQVKAAKLLSSQEIETHSNRYSFRENRITKFVDEIESDDDDDSKDIEYKSAESSSDTAVSTSDDENLTNQQENTERIKTKTTSSKIMGLKQRTKKIYKCSKCGKKLKTKFGLQGHLEYHKDLEKCKWGCKICGKNCGTKRNLQAHVTIHSRRKPLKCRFCLETFLFTTTLNSHMRDKHGNEKELKERTFSSCKRCGKSFPTLQELKSHMNRKFCIKREFKENVKCGQCDEVFNSNVAMWTHKKEIHKVRVCVECGKQFEKDSRLKNHLEYHKDPKEWKFECSICGQKCATKPNLGQHMAKHLKKKKNRDFEENISTEYVSVTSSRCLVVECQVCKRKFTSFLNKEYHYKKCHDLSGINGKKEVKKCEITGCNAYFLEKRQLKMHCYNEHKEASGLENDEGDSKLTKRFVCGKCGKSLAQKATLQRHLEYHKDPSEWKWECGTCGRKSVSEFKLKEHMRTHTKEKPKECPFCEKRFGAANGLSNHIKKFHGDVKQIEGEMDGKKTSGEVVRKGKSSDKVGRLTDREEGDRNESSDKVRVRNLEKMNTANLLTKKGDCFGDGTLVELEDLD